MADLKKVISLLLVLCVFSSALVITPVTAYAEEGAAADGTISFDEEKTDTLTALGIIDQDFLAGDKYISRAEFVKYAVLLMGKDTGMLNDGENPFKDVEPSDTYYDYIIIAKNLNLIKVPDDGLFLPDNPISYDEALIIMVRVAGYEKKANSEGGLSGYYRTASQMGFTSGISADDNGCISRVNVLNMLYNMLSTTVLVSTGTNGTIIQYTEDPQNTVLSVYHEIYTYEGIVTKNPYTTLTVPSSGTADGYIWVADDTYKVNDTSYYDFIGQYIKYYYTEDDDKEKTIVYAHPFRSEMLTVDSADIESFNGRVLEYSDGGKTKKADIASGYNVLYNSVAFPDFTDKDIYIDQGTVTLVRNRSNLEYETIIIKSFKDYIVNSTNTAENLVYTKYPENISLNILSDGKTVVKVYDASGKPVTGESIAADMVISVYQSKNGSYTAIYLSDKIEFGQLSEIDRSNNTVEINYIPKKISTAFYEDLEKLSPGYEGDFYYNYLDMAVGVKNKVSTGIQYGYLMNMGQEDSLDAPVQLKILGEDGSTELYPLRDKVKVDGENISDLEVLSYAPLLQNYNGKKYAMPQIIKYSLNANGEVIYIDTVTLGSREDADSTLSKISVTGASYRGDSKMFAHSVILSTTCKIFIIPVINSDNPEDLKQIDDEDYRVGVNEFQNNERYDIDAYDVSDGGVANVIVHRVAYDVGGTIGGNYAAISTSNNCAVVEKVVDGWYNEGECKKIYLFSNGISSSYFVNNENTIKKPKLDENGQPTGEYVMLEPGDIVRYKTNFKGELDGIVVDFDISRTDAGRFTTDNGEDVGKAYGMVYSQGDGGIRMSSVTYDNGQTFDFSPENLDVFAVGRASITIIDFKNPQANGLPRIRTASPGEIIDYKSSPEDASILFIHSKWFDIMESFIIKR